jgi:two-component system OmpR family sensor kinase
MASLRARLFAGLALLAVATGLAAGGLAFRWAFQEAIELQDAILVQVGELAVKDHLQAELPAERGVDAEARIVIEELSDAPDRPQSATVLPSIPNGLPDGIQTLPWRGEKWRVLVRTRRMAAEWRLASRPRRVMKSRATARCGPSYRWARLFPA